MEAETLVRVSAPLLLCLVYLAVERRHNQRARIAARLKDLLAGRALRARLAAGADVLRVRVVGETGKPVVLGTSKEDAQSISGTPTLQTEHVTLRAEDGRLLGVPAGQQMRIEPLPGARRNVIDTVTTATGVEQRYSFELTPDQPFEIFAVPPVAAAGAGPFRTAEAAEALAPIDSVYVAGGSLRSLIEPPAETTPATETYRPWAIGVALLGAVIWAVPEAGTGLWVIFIAGGLLWTAVMWLTAEAPVLSRTQLEELERSG